MCCGTHIQKVSGSQQLQLQGLLRWPELGKMRYAPGVLVTIRINNIGEDGQVATYMTASSSCKHKIVPNMCQSSCGRGHSSQGILYTHHVFLNVFKWRVSRKELSLKTLSCGWVATHNADLERSGSGLTWYKAASYGPRWSSTVS